MLFLTIIQTESGGAVNQRHIMVAIFLLGIAACATSGPESAVSGAKAESSVTTSNAAEGGADGVIEQVGVSDASMETTLADDDELVCTKEKLTGSRIPTTVCLTRGERRRLQEISQSYVEAARRKPGSNPSQ